MDHIPLPEPPEPRDSDKQEIQPVKTLSEPPVVPARPQPLSELAVEGDVKRTRKERKPKSRDSNTEKICSQSQSDSTSTKKGRINNDTKPKFTDTEKSTMSTEETTLDPAKARVVKREPSMPKNVRKSHLARQISYKEEIPLGEAEARIEGVESSIREMCSKGHRVEFGDGYFREIEKTPTVRTVQAPGADTPQYYVVDAHKTLHHRNIDPRRLGVPHWEAERTANGELTLKHNGKKVNPDNFKPTKDDLKAAIIKN